MAELIDALSPYLGNGWLLAVVVAILYVANSGFIQWVSRLFGEHRQGRLSEREQLSEDQRQLISNYETEAENQRRWRAEDVQRYEALLARKDEVIDRMSEAALLSERGNARLRHALNNLVHAIIGQHDLAVSRGERPAISVDGLRGLFGISDDLDDKLQALFDHSGREPPASDAC